MTSFVRCLPGAGLLHKVEELVGVPVKYVSTGPGRDETIVR
jgi:adenylosuccinate synthase